MIGGKNACAINRPNSEGLRIESTTVTPSRRGGFAPISRAITHRQVEKWLKFEGVQSNGVFCADREVFTFNAERFRAEIARFVSSNTGDD